jgi:hypothetical protein
MNGALTLRSNLPSLLTDCVLVGHARKADVVFTWPQFFAICSHMMNGNAVNFFNIPYQDKDGRPKYAKAFRANCEKRILWSWDTITGEAKSPASIGFYPTNPERESRWSAMDFDAHDGDFMRARDLALKAFTILYQQSQLFVCLTTSAGDPQQTGWHLFVFSREFYPCEGWTRLLKQVAAQIGAPIQDGVCEIFPNEFRGIGKPLRAPGTWNPKTNNCGLILCESLTQSFLPSLPYGREREGNALSLLCEPRGGNSPVHRVGEVFRGEHGEWKERFAITALGTRHHKLTKLVGTAFFQSGREVARRNAEFQHGEATPAPNASSQEHLAEFDKAWAGMERKWFPELSAAEREKYDRLTTQTERDAFRIIRNWSKKASPNEFKIRAQSLGDRVGISLSGACKLRRRFCSLNILRQTQACVSNKYCARFRWTAADEQKRHQSTLISPQQWNGDPGDVHLRKAKGAK